MLAGVEIKGALQQVQFLTLISHVCCILQSLLAHNVFPESYVGPRVQTLSAIKVIGGNLRSYIWVMDYCFGPQSLGNLPLWSV